MPGYSPHSYRCKLESVFLHFLLYSHQTEYLTQNTDKVEATATNHAGQLFYYSLDITDENAVAETFATFGPTLRYPLKGLVSCAGLSLNGPSTDFPAASFCRMLDINVTGTFLVAQATAREMVKTRSTGSMVLVASMSGYVSNKVPHTRP